MQPDYSDVCLKHRLEQSNASMGKNKAVVCIQMKDFFIKIKIITLFKCIESYVACMNQIAAFGQVSCTNLITALYAWTNKSTRVLSLMQYVGME